MNERLLNDLKTLEPWRCVWRWGFAPQFRTGSLHALAEALRTDSAELLQGATTDPLPLQSHADEIPTCLCPVGFLARVEGAETVADVEERFAEACMLCDRWFGEPTACRRFLNWIDDTPREVAFAALLVEIEVELVARSIEVPGEAPAPAPPHAEVLPFTHAGR